jgi:hypothetical protein
VSVLRSEGQQSSLSLKNRVGTLHADILGESGHFVQRAAMLRNLSRTLYITMRTVTVEPTRGDRRQQRAFSGVLAYLTGT